MTKLTKKLAALIAKIFRDEGVREEVLYIGGAEQLPPPLTRE